MNNNIILVGCIAIVALVAVVAMAGQTSNDFSFQEQNIAGLPTEPAVEYDFVPNRLLSPETNRYWLFTNEQGDLYVLPQSEALFNYYPPWFFQNQQSVQLDYYPYWYPQANMNQAQERNTVGFTVTNSRTSSERDYYPPWFFR